MAYPSMWQQARNVLHSQTCIVASLLLSTWVSSSVEGDVGLFKRCTALTCTDIKPADIADSIWRGAAAMIILG